MDDFNAIFNQGFAHFKAQQYPQAQSLFGMITRQVPHPDAMRWLGAALQAQHKFSEAIDVYHRLNAIEPNTGAVHCGLSVCYDLSGNVRMAGYHYERAMKLSPFSPDMRWNRALYLLAQGDYREGWADYRWGYMVPGCRSRRTVEPEWQGETIPDGQTLFVWAEQGFGDVIQFSRYLKKVRSRVGNGVYIKFECADELLSIFEGNPDIDELMSRQIDYSIPGGCDHHVSLMSLPAIFDTTIETVPWDGPYMAASPEKVAKWDAVIGTGDTLKVGVCWRGAAGHNNDALRSMTLKDIEPLAGIEGVTLFGICKGGESFTYGPDLAPQTEDFGDTAAVIECLDIVISVDTAMAHMAGAMGAQTWVILPERAEWRWGMDGAKTTWYPDSELYRCGKHGWSGAVSDIHTALSKKVSS